MYKENNIKTFKYKMFLMLIGFVLGFTLCYDLYLWNSLDLNTYYQMGYSECYNYFTDVNNSISIINSMGNSKP